MARRLREAVRGIVVDREHRVLLVKYVFPSGAERWGTPGGGLDPGETHVEGLRRELYEELGLVDPPIGPHVWDRVHWIKMVSGHDGQRDRFHLVETDHFTPEPTIGWEQMNAEYVFDIRWWTLDEIDESHEQFVPATLVPELRRILTDGPPTTPVDVGV